MSHFAFQNGCLTEIFDFLMLTLLLTTKVLKHILFKIKNTTTIKLKWGNCMMQWEPLWSSFPWQLRKAVGSSSRKMSYTHTHTHTHPCITVFRKLWIPDWDLTPLPKLFPQTAKFWQLMEDWFDSEHQASTVNNFFHLKWKYIKWLDITSGFRQD